MTAVHDSVCRQRSLMMAFGALIAAVAFDGITMPMAARGTNEAIGPFDLVEIFGTGFFIRKAFNELVEAQSFLFGH